MRKRLNAILNKNIVNTNRVDAIEDFVGAMTQSFEIWKWQNNFDTVGTLKYYNKKEKKYYTYGELYFFWKRDLEEKDKNINFK